VSFVEAAHYLTQRTSQSDQVSFQTGSALDLPFEAGAFDIALLQHVAMNIADRGRLYREVRRMLRPGGRIAVFDIVAAGGEPLFPVPWAQAAETSFLLTAAETRDSVERCGFRTAAWRDDTDAAKAWIAQLRTPDAPPAPHLGQVIGPGFAERTANLGRNLTEGRLGVLTAVFTVI
jgi:SAM-dependent methyltransferase